jgi:glycosyltransferase involved in cell wall biosynthesis
MFVFAFRVWLGTGTNVLPEPDVIVGSSLTLFAALSAERLARRRKVPFVLEIRDLWPQTLIDMGMSSIHPAVLLFGAIEKYLYRHADRIITLLPHSADHMAARGARRELITCIPNGVDMEMVPTPNPPRNDGAFTVMYAGSHGLSDELNTVLDAAAILHREAPKRFCFRFIGDGPSKDALRRRVEKEHIDNVVFEKPVPKLTLLSRLPEADAFILSAKKTDLYQNGISPNKLCEYMAAGRPTIVAVDTANNPVAEAEGGITVAPEDPAAMAEAIKSLAAMPVEERWQMGIRARLYVQENYSSTVLARRLEQVLESALAGESMAQAKAASANIDTKAA